MSEQPPQLYRGSVKDVLGPILQKMTSKGSLSAIIFEYTDAYSVFDWGRMPDPLPHKGEALAVLAADWFEKMERPETWKEFSKTPVALALRKQNRFGSSFIECGEKLQQEGLRTHYLGVLSSINSIEPSPLNHVPGPIRHLAVKQVSVAKPTLGSVLGRTVPDYQATRSAPEPRLVPLEVIFRFSCPLGSSLLERFKKDPSYLATLGFGDSPVQAGQRWDFPILELFTKLETSDRPVSLVEALAISGLSSDQLQDLLFKTAWIAGFLRASCAKVGLELADGKLEWGISNGESFLVDAIGPDELRILKDGIQLSKEFLRNYYRKTPWYDAINRAKREAHFQGISEWKRLVAEGPGNLPHLQKDLATQLYLALANQLTGKNWFPKAWSLDQVVEGLRGLSS